MFDFDIEVVAAGDYAGAPSLDELHRWARDCDIAVKVESPNLFSARFKGCGGFHPTRDGALHLLYHRVYGARR